MACPGPKVVTRLDPCITVPMRVHAAHTVVMESAVMPVVVMPVILASCFFLGGGGAKGVQISQARKRPVLITV